MKHLNIVASAARAARVAGAVGVASVLFLLPLAHPLAQTRPAIAIRVTETSGIRRTEFPVRATVRLSQGALPDVTRARLSQTASGADVPAQYTAVTAWPDRSVQVMDVDFNASLAPGETRDYKLNYGPDIAPAAAPRGLAVTEDANMIQVGNVKFSKNASPLIVSANYRGEFINQGSQGSTGSQGSQGSALRNGFAVIDRNGVRHELSEARNLRVELLKRGPLVASLQYSGEIPVDASYAVPVRVFVEMPNSKSWVKLTALVSDSSRRVRDLTFDTPFSFGAFPWLWDFGTENGTYGVFRTANDVAVLTQVVEPGTQGARSWKVETGTQASLNPYEMSVRSTLPPVPNDRGKVASGWGHFQGATTAVPFAIDMFGMAAGTYTITLTGQGQATYAFAPGSGSETSYALPVYQHFVATPVPIGAATTPTSMLHPPEVRVN